MDDIRAAEKIAEPAADAPRRRFLLVTRHDYRTRRKAGIHFLVDELQTLGDVQVFSCSFSLLSKLKGDARLPLAAEANRVVRTPNGVETYLWKTLVHPCRVPHAAQPLMDVLFRHYGSRVPRVLRDWLARADVILFESAASEVFYPLVRKLNPGALFVYLYSDTFEAVNAPHYLREMVARTAGEYDKIMVKSPLLAQALPKDAKVFLTSQGFDKAELRRETPSPYAGGVNLVSVGNMLFDPTVFEIAAPAFPEATFHIIGGGPRAETLAAPNVKVYGEMPFAETLAYLQHADAGIAPYQGDKVAPYLVDTSLKLGQYRVLGLPAICPAAVTGDYDGRYGYTPGDAASIVAAVRAALDRGRFPGVDLPSWHDVALEMLLPPDDPAARRVTF